VGCWSCITPTADKLLARAKQCPHWHAWQLPSTAHWSHTAACNSCWGASQLQHCSMLTLLTLLASLNLQPTPCQHPDPPFHHTTAPRLAEKAADTTAASCMHCSQSKPASSSMHCSQTTRTACEHSVKVMAVCLRHAHKHCLQSLVLPLQQH
jgi:hypothetical protein